MSVIEISHSSSRSGSHSSRQLRFGPAPLASFEDLPIEDQNTSSEDEKQNLTVNQSSDIIFIVTDYDKTNQNSDSNETLYSPSINLQPKFTECKRKGSWTDFFSLRKSLTKPKDRKFSLFNFNFFTKEVKRNSLKSEKIEIMKSNNCNDDSINDDMNNIANRIINEPDTNMNKLAYSDHQLEINNSVGKSTTNVSIEVQCSDSTQENDNEMNSFNANYCREEGEEYHTNMDNVVDCESCCQTDDDCEECNYICSSEIRCRYSETDEADVADNEDNDEVDSINKSNVPSFDGELDLLLTSDQLDHHNWSIDELCPKPIVPAVICSKNNKLNLKLNIDTRKAYPIDRPRSTTPINVDSFEAYITDVKSTNLTVPQCDKLTITLPGTQFNLRHKFARKSNPYIWQEFCEKGLKSPKIFRKRANSCFPQINQNSFFNDAFESNNSPENLTPITPIKSVTEIDIGQFKFDDCFWDYNIAKARGANHANEIDDYTNISSHKNKISINNIKSIEINCSCECNSSVTSSAVNNLTSLTTCSEISSCTETSDNESNASAIRNVKSEYNEDQPLVSPCDCACHHQPITTNQNVFNDLDYNSISKNNNVSIMKAVYNYEEDACNITQYSSSTLSSSTSSSSSTFSISAQLLNYSTASHS